MQTKIILAIVAASLVVAALVGVTAAQFANTQNRATVNPNYNQAPSYERANGNAPPYGTNTGYNQNGYGCYGYGAQTQNPNQPQYGSGMMGNGYGYGMGRCR